MKNNKFNFRKFFIGFMSVIVLFFTYIYVFAFNIENMLDSSILKDRKFIAEVVEVKSKAGIKAYLFKDNTNPIISIDFILKEQGYAYDKPEEKGIANLVSIMMTKGAGDLDNQAFKDELEENGISISFGVDKDDFSGNLLMTRENKDKAIELFKKAIYSPRFDKKELDLVKKQLAYSFKRQKETPSGVLSLMFLDKFYGSHPYGNNPIGDYSYISKVNVLKLKSFFEKRFSIENLIVGVSGDISVEETSALLDDIFGKFSKDRESLVVGKVVASFDGKDFKENFVSSQNVAMFNSLGVSRNDVDFYPLYIANYILGGAGLNSRLSMIARENEGLTYGIYTSLSPNDKIDLINGSFSTIPENYDRMREIVEDEWRRMGEEGVSEKEFEMAKKYLVSSYNLRFANISSVSSMLVYMQKLDLGMDFLQKRNDYIKNVTIEEVNMVAKKYFAKSKINWFSVGTFKNE